MSRPIAQKLLPVCAILGLALTPVRADAQSQVVNIFFGVPYTLRDLHPDITDISLTCYVAGASMGVVYPAWKSISRFPRPDSSAVVGTIARSFKLTVPADALGTTASYNCGLIGRTSDLKQGALQTQVVDLRFKVQTPSRVSGTFVW